MSAAGILYGVAQRSLRAAEPLLRTSDSKLARGVRARRDAHRVLVRWGEGERDPGRPTVWFHAPSVGESRQALAVLDALRTRRAGLQVAFTYFSPTAEASAARVTAEVAACLPWDLRAPMAAVLAALEPGLLVFTKTEVWPTLAHEAARRGVRVALVGASVPPGAGRLGWAARKLLRPTWGRIALAAAIGEADAANLRLLGVRPGAVRVTGDPGIDSAARRAAAEQPDAPHVAPFLRVARPTVVAGSTWPADERVLLPALATVRRDVPELRVIVAPHEPDDAHVSALGARLAAERWRWARLSEVEASGSADGIEAVVVDRVGVLADLYALARVAYVGGGFGTSGLHSVLEPAAAGVPVAFGPRHQRADAAGGLIGCGGGRAVVDTAELARVLLGWLSEHPRRDGAAASALAYIEAHRGAADRTAALLDDLIPGA